MRGARVPWPLLLICWALACGGLVERNHDELSAGRGGSAGSPPSGSDCRCDPSECPPGYRSVPSPDGCCFGCQLDLDACTEQRLRYDEYRATVLSEQTLTADQQTGGCGLDEECMLFEDRTGCSPACSYPIPTFAKRGIADRLYAYAEMNCNPECPTPPIPPCAPPAQPRCVAGLCQ